LYAMVALAASYQNQRKDAEAETLNRRTLEIIKRVLGPEHPLVLDVMHNLALGFSHSSGKAAEAVALYQQTVDSQKRVLGPAHQDTLRSMEDLLRVHRKKKEFAESEALCNEAIKTTTEKLGREHPTTLTWMNNLGSVLREERKDREAEQLFREALTVARRVLPPEHAQIVRSLRHLGELAEAAGHWDEALALSEERSMLDPSDTELSLRTAALHAWLGNEANHARFCQQILARVQGTQDPVVADRAARAFCLRP
jgi:tetratricopeptide (TPR) repeat protein